MWSRATLAVGALGLLIACKRSASSGSSDAGTFAAKRDAECEGIHGRAKADQCYANKARATSEEGYCFAIQGPTDRNLCLKEVASQTNRDALCAPIDDDAIQASCALAVGQHADSTKPCEALADRQSRGECIAVVAEHAGRAELCESIEIPTVHDECVRKVGRKTRADLCDKVKSAPERDDCLAADLPPDPARCARIVNVAVRGTCSLQVARERHDPTACEGAPEDRRAGCYDEAYSQTIDVASCEKAPSSVASGACFRRVATATRDATVCARAPADARDDCMMQAWSSSVGSVDCGRLASAAKRAVCANSYYSRSKDPRICALVTSQTRELCQKVVRANVARR